MNYRPRRTRHQDEQDRDEQDRDEQGFTLIELLVVIIILGILAGVVVFAVGGINDKGQSAARVIDARTVRTAQEAFFAKKGYYAQQPELVSAGFLSDVSTLTTVDLTCKTTCAPGQGTGYTLAQAEATLVMGVNPQSAAADFSGSATALSPLGGLAGVKSGFGMSPANTNIFEGLVRMTPDFQVEPALAERWDLPGTAGLGPNTWRFHLRKGVMFHNNTEMTAADVIYTFNNRIANNGTLKIAQNSAVAVPGNNYAVDVTTRNSTTPFAETPNARLIEQLTHPQNGTIIANNTVPFNGTTATPVGTGPFKMTGYTKGTQLVVARHETYWGAKAKLKTITFKFFADSNARLLALQSGELDMMYDVPTAAFASLSTTPGLKGSVSPPGFNEVIWINSHRADDPATAAVDESALSDATTTTGPLNNGNRVRKAIAAAIDRSSIINATYPQGAVVSNTFVPAASLGAAASTVVGPTFSQAEANTQLNAAGWTCTGVCGPTNFRTKAGKTLTVQMINGYTPTSLRGDSDILVEKALEAVGIDVVRTRITDAQQSIYDGHQLNGTMDLYMERILQTDANPASPPTNFLDCSGGTVGATGNCPNSGLNAFGYAKWLAPGATFEGFIATARTTTNRDTLKQQVALALKEATDNYVAVVELAAVQSLFGMKNNVEGYVQHGSLRAIRFDTVYRGV